ncbi:hypothetical protein BC827DRAFT_236974 [Russula dissimulans]|nr:hypothetical protein BC827DRAFT_236974 [Russula dissimulans]
MSLDFYRRSPPSCWFNTCSQFFYSCSGEQGEKSLCPLPLPFSSAHTMWAAGQHRAPLDHLYYFNGTRWYIIQGVTRYEGDFFGKPRTSTCFRKIYSAVHQPDIAQRAEESFPLCVSQCLCGWLVGPGLHLNLLRTLMPEAVEHHPREYKPRSDLSVAVFSFYHVITVFLANMNCSTPNLSGDRKLIHILMTTQICGQEFRTVNPHQV